MFIVRVLIAILIGYLIACMYIYPKLKKKDRECLNKKQMIKNRDMLIEEQQNRINLLKIRTKIYDQIKQIYRTEPKLINRHDKVKELIEKDND